VIDYFAATGVWGDTLELNNADFPFDDFTMKVDTRRETRPRTQQHGTWPTWQFLGERKFSIGGKVLADDSAGYWDRRLAFMRVFQPAPRRGYRYTTLLTMLLTGFQEVLQAETTMDAGEPELPLQAAQPSWSDFQIALSANDPRLYSTDEQELRTGAIGASGNYGINFPVNFPVSWGRLGVAAGALIINNMGNIETEPKIDVVGGCANPVLSKVNSDGTTSSIVFNGLVIPPGQVITVDLKTRQVSSSVGSNLYYTIDRSSTRWWSLDPGQNEVSFAAYSADPTAYASIKWRNAYML
jgi:hypothetical protein